MREDQKTKLKELREKKSKGEDLDASEQSVLDALESLESTESTLKEKSDEFNETVKGLQSGLDGVRTKVSDQEKVIKDLKEKAGQQDPQDGGGADPDDEAKKAQKAKADADALQAKLMKSEEGKKLLQEAWDNMDVSQRNRMGTDDEFRLSVYKYAESQVPEPEPKPPWDTSGDQSREEESDVAKFFGKQQERRAPSEKRSAATKTKENDDKFDGSYSEDYIEDDRTK